MNVIFTFEQHGYKYGFQGWWTVYKDGKPYYHFKFNCDAELFCLAHRMGAYPHAERGDTYRISDADITPIDDAALQSVIQNAVDEYMKVK